MDADDEHDLSASGDIKGLTTKFNILLADFAAGNTSSTQNEIVYILDGDGRRYHRKNVVILIHI